MSFSLVAFAAAVLSWTVVCVLNMTFISPVAVLFQTLLTIGAFPFMAWFPARVQYAICVPSIPMYRDTGRYKLFSRRVAVLGGGKLALLGLLAGRMYQLQVVESDKYTTLAEEPITFVCCWRCRRILDRYGRPWLLIKKITECRWWPSRFRTPMRS